MASGITFPVTYSGKATRVDGIPNSNVISSTTNINQYLKNAILTGQPYPIKMLFIQGATPLSDNPPASVWRQCYTGTNLDMIVIADIVYNSDTDYADYILPETHPFERTMGYGGFGSYTVWNPQKMNEQFNFLCAANQVVTPLGEEQPSTYYFPQIANLVGFGQYFNFNYDDYLTYQLKPMGITIQQLRQMGVYWPTPIVTRTIVYGKQSSYSTDSGRLNFFAVPLASVYSNKLRSLLS